MTNDKKERREELKELLFGIAFILGYTLFTAGLGALIAYLVMR